MRSWCVRLEAKCAARGCFRSYEIALGPDLFGAWMVEMNYGRVGTAGRTKVRSFETVEAAQAQVRVCLRKACDRTTADRRQVRTAARCGIYELAGRCAQPVAWHMAARTFRSASAKRISIM